MSYAKSGAACPDRLLKKHLRDPSSVIQVAFLRIARVVKWQTRTFEGRMPKGVGVQVPPRAEGEIGRDQQFATVLVDFRTIFEDRFRARNLAFLLTHGQELRRSAGKALIRRHLQRKTTGAITVYWKDETR